MMSSALRHCTSAADFQVIMSGMTGRQIVTLLSLGLGLCLERFAYFGVRSLLVLAMTRQLGMDQAQAVQQYGLFTGFVYCSAVIAAGVVLVVGPRLVLLGGSVLSVVGIGLITTVNPSLLIPGLVLLGLGSGGVRIAIYAIAGGMLRQRNEAVAIAAITLYYAATNVGAFMAPLIVGSLGQKNFSLGFGAAALGMVAAVVSFGTGVAATGVREEGPRFGNPRGVAGAMLFVGAMLPVYVLMEGAGLARFQIAQAGALGTWFSAVNPAVVVVAGMLLVLVCIVLSAMKVKIRAAWVFGAGLILFALANSPALIASLDGAAPARLISSEVLAAIGEVVLSGAALARISTAASPRLVALVLAPFYLVSYLSNFIASHTESGPLASVVSWSAFGLTLVIGVLALAFAGVLHRMFFDEPSHAQVAPPTPVASL